MGTRFTYNTFPSNLAPAAFAHDNPVFFRYQARKLTSAAKASMATEATAVMFATEAATVLIRIATESAAIAILVAAELAAVAVLVATKLAAVTVLIAAIPVAVTVLVAAIPAAVAIVTNTVIITMAAVSQVAKGVPVEESLPVGIVGRNIDGGIMGVRKIVVSIRVNGVVGLTVVVGHATAA